MIAALLECCAGMDVGKKFVVVCVLKGAANADAQAETGSSAPTTITSINRGAGRRIAVARM